MRHKIKTNLILKNLLLALTYFIAGKLSLLLAIPPGYASAIWPSCGIAVAAILIFGPKLLPGVLLGSLIINLSLGPSIDSFQALINSLSVPLAIAIGASLQAFFGATLVKKQSKFSMSLDGYQSIFYLYFYGGIIACLVSSLIGGLALTMSNTIPWSNFSITVLTWWVGDTIGVVVFTPIMLLIGNIGDKEIRTRFFITLTALIISFIVTITFFVYTSDREQLAIDTKFKNDFKQINNSIQSKFSEYSILLKTLNSYYVGSNHVSREEFKRFTQGQLKFFKGINTLEWVPKISRKQVNRYVKSAMQDGIKNFNLTEMNIEGNLTGVKDREYYHPVYYIEPFRGNENALGYDVGSNKARMDALNSSTKLNEIVSTISLNLNKNQSIRMVQPFKDKGELIGHLIGVFDLEQLMTLALRHINTSGQDILVLQKHSDGNLLAFSSNKDSLAYLKNENNFLSSSLKKTVEFTHGNKIWEIILFKRGEKLLAEKDWNSWFILAAGLLFTGLFGGLILIITGQTNQIRKVVIEKTNNLNMINTELEKANVEIEKTSKYKSQFLANMSHEIRTPMNGVVGMVNLINEKILDEENKEYLKSMKSSSALLLAIIDDILDYSKLEVGRLKLRSSTVNLHHSIRDTINLFKPLAIKNNVILSLEINPCVPEFIISDSVRLKQIFSNLISNAIKFTSDGEVKTTIDAVKIGHEYQIICTVKDSGIGISENSQNELFKSFNQVDNSVTRKHGGAGLGLSISRSLAEMLGGEINLSSQGIGTGSTFQFNFVTEESNDGILNLGDKMFDHHDGIDINFGKMYPLDILIVEDNVMNQQVIQTLLTKLGYVTDLAVDGVECLEKINKKTYDLIFMDIQMPRMDGITATIEIRKLTKFTNLSISAMTANAFDEDRDKCFKAGMDDFIAKPIKVEKLKEVITSVFTLNEKSSKDVG